MQTLMACTVGLKPLLTWSALRQGRKSYMISPYQSQASCDTFIPSDECHRQAATVPFAHPQGALRMTDVTANDEPIKNELLTLSQFARMAGLTRDDLKGREERGQLPPPLRFGTKDLWLVSDVNRWLDERRENEKILQDPTRHVEELELSFNELHAHMGAFFDFAQQKPTGSRWRVHRQGGNYILVADSDASTPFHAQLDPALLPCVPLGHLPANKD
jgi:predicted DNA-binding transcriptional regulator AlpA